MRGEALVDVVNGRQRRLYFGGEERPLPELLAWSADGKHLAARTSGSQPELFIVDPRGDGSDAVRVNIAGGFLDALSRPTWAPDSERVAFVACTSSACRLQSVAADGTDRVVHARTADANLGIDVGPSWQRLPPK